MLAPILEPDADAMLRHLQAVFGDAGEGLIELAWTDPEARRLAHAQMFGTDRLHDVAERAAALNRTPNCNVYIGAALRQPTASVNRRGSDADFHAATCVWADVDDDVVNDAVAHCRAAGLMPNLTVVTGRRPHLRAQLWWRLDQVETDPVNLRALNAALARALGGDPTVVNPGRVLRLGGSVAWPAKPGRSLERTEVHRPQDGRPASYPTARITEVFGSRAPLLSAAAAPPAKSAPRPAETPDLIPPSPSTPPPAPPLDLAIGSPSVESALRTIRSGARWHDTVVRLVAHWIARGWSDAEIFATAAALTAPGWSVDDTLRDLVPMIRGARSKWNLPNPTHGIDIDASPPAPIAPEWEDGAAAVMIPRRRWLVGSFAVRGQLSVLVAPPGAGKSTLGIAYGVAAATGRGEIVGETVHESVKAWIWNNEDDKPELRRRLAAVMQHWGIAPTELRGRLALNSGSERPLMVARAGKDGVVQRLPDIDAIIEIVRREGIGLLIVDPFVETHAVDENDNAQVKAVAALWREVARRCDCAVIIVHHTGKPPAAAPDSWAGSLSASRGASSLAGVARQVRTIFSMSEKDAERLLGPDRLKERFAWVRQDDAKGNLARISDEPRWFERVSVTIANGEEVGLLVPGDPAFSLPDDPGPDPNLDDEVEAALDRYWQAGNPLSDRPEARGRFAPVVLGRELKVAGNAVRDAIVRLQQAGRVVTDAYGPKRNRKGLRSTASKISDHQSGSEDDA